VDKHGIASIYFDFKRGENMKYTTFNNHSDEKSSFVKNTFNNISKEYDLLNGILSFGVYRLWHRRVMKESGLKIGGSVIDFCTGTGELLLKFNRRFNLSKGAGIDISSQMLKIAQNKIDKLNLNEKLELYEIPAENTGVDEKFDCSTIAFALRNVKDVGAVFTEMSRVTKVGGKVLALELTKPRKSIIKGFYKMYLKIVMPLVGKIFSGNWEAYKYLGVSIINFPEAEVVLSLMKKAGLKNTKAIPLTFGAATLFVGEK
jgi:demethylmenaquinone methyltransferase/2-methoxy-6-polyprenyl-1,4-benzoquinol methylase